MENPVKKWFGTEGNQIIDPREKLDKLHTVLKFSHGNIKEEYPEQLMVIKFLDPNSVVLELGGNLGRNSCIIATKLTDDKNLVVLESNPDYIKLLSENRDQNGFNFHIENSALSKIPLIQREWLSAPLNSPTIPHGYIKLNTITYSELVEKYKLEFDTLVVDCEGALHQILLDDPDILLKIKMVIIENDWWDINPKKAVEAVFTKYGLKLIYNEAGGWGPCHPWFYQIFSK